MMKLGQHLQEGNGMKWYKVTLTANNGTVKEIDAITKAQAIIAIKNEGFQWDEQLEEWEQTYCNVDPFDDYAVDTVFTKAWITVIDFGKGFAKGL